MATQPMGGLPDPSKINQYGAPTADVEEYQRSLEDSVRALEQRYAQPNWFNVAAGFFKPQLGGFAASLGSAAQALGENVEKQRESQLPIAQMRAQLAASKIGMGQNKGASEAFAAWKATGKPMDEATYSQIVGLAPNSSVAAAAKAAYEGDKSTQTLKQQQTQITIAQVQAGIDTAKAQRAMGALTEDQYNARVASLNAQLEALPSGIMKGPTDTAIDKKPPELLNSNAPAYSGPAVSKAPVVEAPAAAAAAPAATAKAFTPLDSKSLSYDSLTPAQHAAVNDMLTSSGLRPIMGTESGRAGWERNIARLQKENPAGLVKFIDAINAQGGLTSTPTTTSAVAPAQTSVVPDDFKYKPSYTLPYTQAVTEPEKAKNASVLAQAAASNKVPEQQYQSLQQLNDPRIFNIANAATEGASNMLKNKPDLAIEVTDQLRREGPLAAMIDKGLNVNWTPVGGASIGVDVRSGLKANLTSAQRSYQDTLLNYLATTAYYGLRARGIDPEIVGAEKFKQLLLQETGIDQGPLAISHQLELNKHHLMYAKNLLDAYDEGLPKTQGYLAPHYEVYKQSPRIKFETDLYNRKIRNEQADYLNKVGTLADAEKKGKAP